jgi:hypothetical protein
MFPTLPMHAETGGEACRMGDPDCDGMLISMLDRMLLPTRHKESASTRSVRGKSCHQIVTLAVTITTSCPLSTCDS